MRSRLFCTSVLLLLALAGPAAARGTLDSILPDIRSAHPGRLSDAEPWTDSDGRTHYRIKWLTPEGRILYFNADADSGRYSSSGDDGQGWREHRERGNGDRGASSDDNDGGGHRSHWNGGDNGLGDGDWHRRDRGGDPGESRGDWHRGGDPSDGRGGDPSDSRGGGWHDGRGGDPNGYRGGNGGDNGGHHHHGGD